MSPGDDTAYAEEFRSLIQAKLDGVAGQPTGDLPVADRFGLARAELRRLGQDGRAEGFNAIYGLCRGLVTAGVLSVFVLLIAAAAGHEARRNLITAAIVAAALVPLLVRFHRFSFYFADQVWRDFAALAGR